MANVNDEIIYKKIEADLKSYEIIHEKVAANGKRGESQSIQIYVLMAALIAFIGVAHGQYHNSELELVADLVLIIIFPMLSLAAIVGIFSMEIKQIYMGLFLNEVEIRINDRFEKINTNDDTEPVLGYEKFRFEKGHRKDAKSNIDLYLLGIVTFLIGVGIPSVWVFLSKGPMWQLIVLIVEIVVGVCILSFVINNFMKVNKVLKQEVEQ